MFKLKANSGVTLLEVLLVVAILAILLIFSIPVYESVQTRNDLSIAVMNSAHALRRAKLLAEASDGDASWGVKFGTSTLVLFRGLSFATRNPSFDEIFDLPSSIKITDTDEIVFAKFSGLPASPSTTTLTGVSQEIRRLNVNAKGMVSY